jgi:hypothetical protein
LAHLVQGLAILLAWAHGASAQQKPFSHALHLKMKPACGDCHAGAGASSLVTDNNLPSQEACKSCHQQPVSIKEPARTLVTRFSHATHLKLGNVAPVIAAAIDSKSYHALPAQAVREQLRGANACTACHRGLDVSEQVGRENMPHMADCLTCHPKIDAPFSCELCHAPGRHLKPVSHTRDYIDVHSTSRANLDKASCVICHGRRFTCLGCH